jgi:hypothetical protein
MGSSIGCGPRTLYESEVTNPNLLSTLVQTCQKNKKIKKALERNQRMAHQLSFGLCPPFSSVCLSS